MLMTTLNGCQRSPRFADRNSAYADSALTHAVPQEEHGIHCLLYICSRQDVQGRGSILAQTKKPGNYFSPPQLADAINGAVF